VDLLTVVNRRKLSGRSGWSFVNRTFVVLYGVRDTSRTGGPSGN
jgi:hypothetical protein